MMYQLKYSKLPELHCRFLERSVKVQSIGWFFNICNDDRPYLCGLFN